MDHETTFVDQTPSDHTMIAYVLDGQGNFEDNDRLDVKPGNLIVFNSGDELRVQSQDEPLHFLMFSGKPIREPVAWAGPVVMNTQEELHQAFAEMRNGQFIKHEYRI
jgi:redox-sensitive bicupin YhaK (pirin superfamily)